MFVCEDSLQLQVQVLIEDQNPTFEYIHYITGYQYCTYG